MKIIPPHNKKIFKSVYVMNLLQFLQMNPVTTAAPTTTTTMKPVDVSQELSVSFGYFFPLFLTCLCSQLMSFLANSPFLYLAFCHCKSLLLFFKTPMTKSTYSEKFEENKSTFPSFFMCDFFCWVYTL